jgi:BCD family chlorophyll transporter-like MFS transporter
LALGAWGAVQATSAGVAVALGGIIRDSVDYFAMRNSLADPSTGYVAVYLIEIILLLATIIAMAPLIKSKLPVRKLQTS